jgi:hypothetical protein
MALFVVVAAWAVVIPVVVQALRGSRLEHVERGLFGNEATEQLISAWSVTVIDEAERELRLARFDELLRTRAWAGTIAEVVHLPLRGASIWRFSDGETWQVDMLRPTPHDARRLVVRNVEPDADRLRVLGYVPGRRDLAISVLDARPLGRAT